MTPSAADISLPANGDLVRCRRLGSVATYRVCDRRGDLVEVEVIEVPGLRAGMRFRFTRDAVAEMQRVAPAMENPLPAPASLAPQPRFLGARTKLEG